MLPRGREVYHSPRMPYRTAWCPTAGNSDLQVHESSDDLTAAATRTPAAPDLADPAGNGALRVEFSRRGATLPSGLLAAVGFGPATADMEPADGPLLINVGLAPLTAGADMELWWANGPVTRGSSGAIRFAHDDQHLVAILELDEREHGGIVATAALAYTQLRRFQQESAFPHLLRIWNYLDAINQGAGDLERYREFCVGRTRGLGDALAAGYPAATAIGHQNSTHRLQVYWLAGHTPGNSIENPRQVSAYRYPRDHGPASPTFARATLATDGTLLISGTASIVGHVSRHEGDPLAQLEETLRNLAALNERAEALRPVSQRTTKHPRVLKVYVRDAAYLEMVQARLREAFGDSPMIFLAADVCRRELLLEIEAMSG